MLDALQERVELWHEKAERLRREFREALEQDRVDGPLIAAVFTWQMLAGLLISTGITIGTALITRALTPGRRLEQGSLAGQEIRLTRAENGTFIPEIYGGPPETDAETLQASHAYALNTKVVPEVGNGFYYRISVAGTTAGTLPTLPTTKGATVASGTATLRCEGRTGGGVKIGAVVIWTPPQPIEKHVTTQRSSGGGKGGPKVTTESISYSISLALLWARGPVEFFRLLANTDPFYESYVPGVTGIPEPTVPPDDPYPTEEPPNPNAYYTRPSERYSGALTPDTGNALVGTVLIGGNAGLALYEGNTTQLPDSVIEADVDGRYGEGSTLAYRNRAYTRHSNFYLDRWGGAVPLFSGVLGHKTIKTLATLCDHLSARTGLLTVSDYDYTAFVAVDMRGLVIGQRYQPAEVMQRQLATPFNAYFVETDKIYGRLRGGTVSAVIDDDELGWVDADSEGREEPVAEIESEIPAETEAPRRFDFKFIDIEKDFEQNLQGDSRQITESEHVETLEIPLTMYAEEAREVTQRELYRRQIEAEAQTFALDWTYLWLEPGMSVEFTSDEGFTFRTFVKTFKPCIGINEGTGVAEDVTLFDQSAVTAGGTIIPPPIIPLPAMTVLGLYDGPPLRDAEEAGVGFYAWAVKRRGSGDFTGSALYVNKGLGYEGPLAVFDREATSGVCATALTGTTSAYGFVEDELTVDLHSDDTLESYTQADLLNGAGVCICGEEVCQILTATREPDTESFPNRWYLTIGLRARRGTFFAVGTHSAGERFVLVTDAVQFVHVDPEEVGLTRTYKMVTSGQSVDDAAEVEFTFTGMKGRYTEPSSLILTRTDGTNGSPLLIRWGLPAGSQLSADERYVVRISSGGTLVRKHTVQADYAEPVQGRVVVAGLANENPALMAVSEDGTIEMEANDDEFAQARSTQIIVGGSRVSWRLDSRNPPLIVTLAGATVPFDIEYTTNEIIVPDHAMEEDDEFDPESGITGAGYYVINARADRFQIASTPGGVALDLSGYTAGTFTYPSPTATVHGVEDGGVMYVQPALVEFARERAVAGGECSIEVRNGVAYFYMIDQQTPRYRSTGPAFRWPYYVRVTMGGLNGGPQAALRMSIQHANARSFLYTREMQEDDFGVGSVPDEVTVSVARLSPVGEGLAAVAIG